MALKHSTEIARVMDNVEYWYISSKQTRLRLLKEGPVKGCTSGGRVNHREEEQATQKMQIRELAVNSRPTMYDINGADALGAIVSSSDANSSAETWGKRKKNMCFTRYLIINEFSMITKMLMEVLSKICCQTKCHLGNCNRTAFGGLNVILFGDLHQFPPIIKTNALYYPDADGISIGRELFECFTTVVTLTQQMRVRDKTWTEMLQRLHVGGCTADDLAMVNTLVLSNPAFREAWNHEALRRHCCATGNIVFVCPAEDFTGVDRLPLSSHEHLAAMKMSQMGTARLAAEVEVAVGMRGMVLLNIATESDLANGSCGTVSQITLDSREPVADQLTLELKLLYPPACVIFKLDHATFPPFEELASGEIPIFPTEGSFRITTGSGKKKTVKRRQLAMTPVYAFTDWKAQGQTMEHVIVDLAEPKANTLDGFHTYVALSRSRGGKPLGCCKVSIANYYRSIQAFISYQRMNI
ncbi:ATP-dependent DNA helicase [Salix suchowensis]|nr:ATP-dependent DNA helicase [Salix suchowensis]